MRGAIDAIMSRYSVRHFLEENISRADMETIIAAAFAAPSARGAYPVRCVVLTKERMAELAAEVEQKTPFLEGQWAIAVCADTRDYPWGGAWIEDCAAAMENMQIAAFGLGFGALWYGVYSRAPKEEQVRRFLNLPEGVEVHYNNWCRSREKLPQARSKRRAASFWLLARVIPPALKDNWR